jgi:CheY-like chemotaxis protein
MISDDDKAALSRALKRGSTRSKSRAGRSPQFARNAKLEVRLMDDMHNWTRIGQGKLDLHREIVDVNVIMRSALKICQINIEAKKLEVLLALRAGSHLVCADPSRLQQVFCTLIDNAVKFTPVEGRISIRSADSGMGRLVIEVADTGEGITPECIQRIFDDFKKGDHDISRPQVGLGLAVLIAKMLIALHGGILTASNTNEGCGSVFRVELDIIPSSSNQPPRSDSATQASLKILLVDDNAETLRAMSRLLVSAGFMVETAMNVSQAMTKLSNQQFNLLISDIGLPDGSGLEIMRYGRDNFGLHGIAFSGYATTEDAIESKAAGFAYHLAKPSRLDVLIDLIKRTAA